MCLAVAVLGAAIVAHAASRKVDFSRDATNQPPTGFEFGHTAGVGRPGKWIVQGEGTNKFLAQTDGDSTRSRFPVPCCRVATGARFEVHFYGRKLYEVEDTTFTQSGRVGVWTKADSVMHFDDLTVITR
jgi:hypothetical protein